jgi:FdhE protein
MNRFTWDARIERAGQLENEYAVAAEVLRFYRKVAEFQKSVSPYSDPGPQEWMRLLDLVEREGPSPLAEAARNLQLALGEGGTPEFLKSRIQAGAHLPDDPIQAFFSRVIQQPYAEGAAAVADIPTGVTRNTCPFCGERPLVAALRPEGDGGKRDLVCSLCFTEWEFRRLLCPNCGEEDHRKLPVYKAAEFPHLRAEACDSCRHYIKAVDLTLDGRAIPEVDELAAIPLDLWARENGYIKLQANILGL